MMNIAIIVFLSILSGYGAQEKNSIIPQIIERIEPAVIADKGTVYLNCTMVIPKEYFSRASWYSIDNNKRISNGESVISDTSDINDDSKFEAKFLQNRPNYIPKLAGILEHVYTYQLIIRKYMESYSKSFRCEIDWPGIAQHQKPFAVGEVILRKAPYIYPLVPRIINENETLVLKCTAKGSPKPIISWVKANGQAFRLPGSPQRVKNETLVLKNVGRHDRGMYRCHAQNNVGNAAEYDVMIEVQYKPTIRQARKAGQYAQMPNEDYEIMIECIVNGYPDPDLAWYRGVYDPAKTNIEIFNGPRHLSQKLRSYGSVGTNITDVFFVLRILNVVDNDMGKYTCLARNNKGYDQKTVNIFKQYICQGALCSIYGSSYGSASSNLVLNFFLLVISSISIILIGQY